VARSDDAGGLEPRLGEVLLQRLQAIGISCPQSVTLQRFLHVLADAGVVSHDVARQLLELHLQTAYSSDQGAPEGIGEITERLVWEATRNLAANPGALQCVSDALATAQPLQEQLQPNPEDTHRRPEDDAAEEIWPPEQAVEMQVQENEEQSSWFDPSWRSGWPGRLSRKQRWTLAASLLLLWSLAMVSIGHLGHARISHLLSHLRAQLFDLPEAPYSPRQQVDQARQRAGEHPDSLPAWRLYAESARGFGFDSDAVIAFSRVVSLQPDDAGALNSLAWLLLTSDEPWLRDPVRALELAERAYVLNQEPNITDTLAEAAFQNGDVKRAVALEEDAVRRLPAEVNPDFFEDQLRKFKAALAE